MSEPQFYKPPSGLTVGEIAALTGAEPRNQTSLGRLITGIAPLERAGPTDLVYIENSKYVGALARTRAGACVMLERFENQAPTGLIVMHAREPYRAFVTVARKLYPDALRPSSLFEAKGVMPGANVHPAARVEDGVTIDPGAVIGPRAAIGAGTVIGATAVIGPDVQIGRDCSIGPGASIVHSLIGDNVIIHAGCRIGQDGFRYHPSAKGHIKVPQLGRVVIQDHVEIGAGTTIDRGGGDDTVIGEGTKIDNLVQIGHNCTIGRHCIIVAQCGLSGSVTLGDHVILAGQVGIADHLTIGEGSLIGAKSGVTSNVPAGQRWLGFPALPGSEFLRAMIALRRQLRTEKKDKA